MKREELKNLGALVSLLIVTGTANGQTNPNPSASVDAFISSEMSAEKFPGVSTVIVKDDKIVWINSYGSADVENSIPVRDTTNFLLASVSKLFTGTAAMHLVENNIIDLNDDVNLYFPWTLQIPGFPSEQVTIKQLMTHTSSIEDNNSVMDTYYDHPDPTITLADCMERYFSTSGTDYSAASNFLPIAPGSMYEYSNMATALNGYLVELASGMPFDEYCKINIFDKLCMDKTSWFFADLDSSNVARPYQYFGGNYIPYSHYGFADYPDGQLRSNVTDMANFMITYLNGGSFGTNSLLSPSSINQMWTPQIPALDAYQGLNWYQEELFHSSGTTWLWGHNGGEQGASTDIYLDPLNKIGICVLTNGEGDAITICDELYDHALTLNSTTGISPGCLISSGVSEIETSTGEKKMIRIIDLLGRETQLKTNTPLIEIYSDGSAERIFIFE